MESPTHSYSIPGTFIAQLVVTNDALQSGSDFALVTIALTLLGTARTASAQQRLAASDTHADSVLEARLVPLVDGFRGTAGIYVRHLRTGATVAIRSDELFPTASMIKVPILVGVFDRMERGTGLVSATDEVQSRYGIPVLSISTLDDLARYLGARPELVQPLQSIQAYRQKYGVRT